MPSSSAPALFFAFVFAAGVALFATGSFLRRTRSVQAWTRALVDDDVPLTAAARIEIAERLALIAQPWAIEVLQTALREEHDARVLAAIERALLQEALH